LIPYPERFADPRCSLSQHHTRARNQIWASPPRLDVAQTIMGAMASFRR
jgi:hypothetical protein